MWRRTDLKATSKGKTKAGNRDIQGVLVVDKQVGLTSHDVVQKVRRLFKTRQVGHAGTLDPVASGVLVILVGTATRIAQYLQEDDKEDHLTIMLGRSTDTQDITGRTIFECDPSGISRKDLEKEIKKYRGSFMQTPPVYSAIKYKGQPLYRLARKGIEVTPEPRRVTIYSIDIDGWDPPRASLKVVCSKGTYMRTLCHDIGEGLRVGGCMESLVRVRSGSFSLDEAVDLDTLQDDVSLPEQLSEAARGLPFPRYEPAPEDLKYILQGRTVPWGGEKVDGPVSVVLNGRLLAIGEVDEMNGEKVLVPKRILEPKVKELFMSADK
jgi:tRNA pseudouridine55 synthase